MVIHVTVNGSPKVSAGKQRKEEKEIASRRKSRINAENRAGIVNLQIRLFEPILLLWIVWKYKLLFVRDEKNLQRAGGSPE